MASIVQSFETTALITRIPHSCAIPSAETTQTASIQFWDHS